jgi:glycosyltransferase involved in cell wall biosynthesis
VEPLVSILIPAHNAARWVADTLQSALDQTWARKEIILIDDGSVDDTLVIARRFSSDIVTIVGQEKQGAAAARNRALALSKGEYIQWLDADDILACDKIAKQLEQTKASSKRLLLSGAWGAFIYRRSKARFIRTPLWCDLSPVEWLSTKMEQNHHMQTATWLVSRELTGLAGPWDVRLSLDDDGEYFCRVLLASSGVHFVREAKVFYRAASSTSLRNVDGSNEKLESFFLSTQLHVQYLLSLENSERVRFICLNYLQRRVRNFVPERPDLVHKIEKIAAHLGGRITSPELGGKYFFIERFVGYAAAKRSRSLLRRWKWSLIRSWDRALARLESGKEDDHTRRGAN